MQSVRTNTVAYAIARKADAGPWVAVNGPQTAGNSTTPAIPRAANSATLRKNIDMYKPEMKTTTSLELKIGPKVALIKTNS